MSAFTALIVALNIVVWGLLIAGYVRFSWGVY